MFRVNKANQLHGADFVLVQAKKEMRDIFRSLDLNGDGGITCQEFKKSLKPNIHLWQRLTQRHIKAANKFFDELDKNGDGEISWKEFAQAVISQPDSLEIFKIATGQQHRRLAIENELCGKSEAFDPPTAQALLEIFHSLDHNGDGMISPSELDMALRENEFVKARLTLLCQGDASRIFSRLDQNRDGKVTWDEFVEFTTLQTFSSLRSLSGTELDPK
eukprot:c2072_g1_i1.p1 GENE.c2072_g1_i1~~c2072_g1_i1.p1  ORF type:complete len:218 (+),score=55.70 c2072_g1_i1:104-757(+)